MPTVLFASDARHVHSSCRVLRPDGLRHGGQDRYPVRRGHAAAGRQTGAGGRDYQGRGIPPPLGTWRRSRAAGEIITLVPAPPYADEGCEKCFVRATSRQWRNECAARRGLFGRWFAPPRASRGKFVSRHQAGTILPTDLPHHLRYAGEFGADWHGGTVDGDHGRARRAVQAILRDAAECHYGRPDSKLVLSQPALYRCRRAHPDRPAAQG